MDHNEEDTLLEYLPEMQERNAVVMIGRMNPPSSGHYKVMNKMKLFIREHPELKLTPIIVVVAGKKSSLDKTKNPLTPEERIKFMESSGHCNGFKFFIATNGRQALGLIRDNGYEPKVIAAGSDRVEGYLKNLDKDFLTPDGEPIEHLVVPGLDRIDAAVATKKDEKAKALDDTLSKMKDGEDVSDDEVSGSLAREAAKLGYFEEFADIVGLKHKHTLARMMYNKIRKALGVDGGED